MDDWYPVQVKQRATTMSVFPARDAFLFVRVKENQLYLITAPIH